MGDEGSRSDHDTRCTRFVEGEMQAYASAMLFFEDSRASSMLQSLDVDEGKRRRADL